MISCSYHVAPFGGDKMRIMVTDGRGYDDLGAVERAFDAYIAEWSAYGKFSGPKRNAEKV